MLKMEIVIFIKKKPFEDEVFSDLFIYRFDIYRLGGAFAEEPLLSKTREDKAYSDFGFEYEIGLTFYRANPEWMQRAAFYIAAEEGGANPNAIDKIRCYNDIGGGDFDLVWTWTRGQKFVKANI